MPRAAAVLGLLLLAAPAGAAPGHLATGRFTERGHGVRGHGAVLRNALAYELSHGAGFELVADDDAKVEALARIRETNRHSTDERDWIEVGHAVGATHLLLGEVRQDRNSCSAFAQLVHLESRATKVSRPGYYDCTNYDLVDLAGDLSEQLTGRRASPPTRRRHRRPPQRPVKIVMRGHEANVDGEDYTFYALERPPADEAAPDEPPTAPTPTAPTPTEPAPTAHAPEPPTETAPPPRAPTEDLGLEGFEALRPAWDPDGAPIFNLYALARALDAEAALVAGLILALPLFFLLGGAFLLRAKPDLGQVWLQSGFDLGVLLGCADGAVLLLYRYVLGRDVLEDTAPYLVASPLVALGLWLVGGRLLRVLGRISLLRRALWAPVAIAGLFAALLLATRIQGPVIYFGVGCALAGLLARAAVAIRRRRKSG